LTSPEAVVVLSTAPDPAEADRLARALVEEGLAACVTRVPGARSLYRWEGAITEAEEILLLIKTRPGHAASVTRRLGELHPYDVPEILVLPVTGGASTYLAWIRDTVDGGSS